MIILPQEVLIRWDNSNKKYYKLKGYEFTKAGEYFSVDIMDVPKGSHVFVNCLCDYCDGNVKMQFIKYNNNVLNAIIKKVACTDCYPKKIKEGNLIKYGVESTNSLVSVQNKKKQTLLDKYGVEHMSQIEEVKEKKKQININNYGVEHYSQTNEYKEKIKQTNLERYGDECSCRNNEVKNKLKQTNLERYECEYTLQNKEIRDKGKQTMLERYGMESYPQTQEYKDKVRIISLEKYGVEHFSQNLQVIEKKMKAFYKNGTCPTSSQQISIYNMLKINNYNVELNYPFLKFSLDIALYINNIKIDIEYDGWYWHDAIKDRRRDEILK